MKPDLVRQVGQCLHGERWQVPLSKNLGVNKRTVRGWMQSTRYDAPDRHAEKLIELLKQRQSDIRNILPKLTRLSPPE